MFHAIAWFLVVALLALWSVAAWALHGVAVWAVTNAGALSGAATGVGALRLPDGLSRWVPPEFVSWLTALLSGLEPVVGSLLHAAPALAGGLTVAAWVVWGIGSALLVLLGAGLHLLIALWRRRSVGGSGPDAGRTLAAG